MVYANDENPCSRKCEGPGHDEDASWPVFVLDDKEYFRYLPHLVAPGVWPWATWYRHYKNGYLPVAGGLMDQTEKFIRAMAVLDNEINRRDEENRKKR